MTSATSGEFTDRSGLPRILVTGGRGQLGREVARQAGDRAVTPGRDELDIADPWSIASVLDGYAPDVVINAAAYTDVDGAESDEDGAAEINIDGARNLAQGCADRGMRLIHISTDYVFSGRVPGSGEGSGDPATAPGLQPHDPTGPVTVYGRTKLAGERAVFEELPEATVLRTAWLYTGARRVVEEIPGGDFVGTMIRLEAQRETLTVVDDQWGSPTDVTTLAAQVLEMLAAEKAKRIDTSGAVHHVTGAGRATWFELARAVFRGLGADPERVRPCSSEEFPRPAPRPAFSVLADSAWRELGLSPVDDWQTSLARGLSALGPRGSSGSTDTVSSSSLSSPHTSAHTSAPTGGDAPR